MRASRKHKAERKFIVQSIEIDGVYVHWQCKASCEDTTSPASSKDSAIPKSYITGDDLKRLKRLNLFESCMLQINDKNYLNIDESDVIVRKSQWKKEQSKFTLSYHKLHQSILNTYNLCFTGNKYRILSSRNSLTNGNNTQLLNNSTKTNIDEQDDCEFDNQNIKLTKCEKVSNSEHQLKNECDPSKLCPLMKVHESDEWQTEEEEEEVLSDSGTTASSCSSNPTPKGSPKKSPQLSHKIRKLKKHRQRDTFETKLPQVGERVVTESLVVYSLATVIWQDGSIESGIPSVELCPIHHLDDHEFFPGDFVLASNDAAISNPSYRDYGVIQNVDHHGRVAKVKWFSTYTNLDEPTPFFKGESEVSVYDLKDHPDFQYRPGTIVIRVANFPTKSCATAGQVVDNYPEGKVKVWWIDGSVTMNWPQDLFEVGQYDSENNFWGNGGESDDESWQTEDEFSEPGGLPQQQHLTANLERARKAMARLEELFIINPNLQSQEVMKKLLRVYKKCRYLDRLMNTSFFDVSNFMGLVERVRKGGSQTTAERLLEKKNRLFNEAPVTDSFASCQSTSETAKIVTKKISLLEATKASSNSNSREDNSSYCSFESTKSCFPASTRQASQESPSKNQNLLVVASEAWNRGKCNFSTSSDISSIIDDNTENSQKFSASSSPSASAYKTPSPRPPTMGCCDDMEKNSSDSGILITLDNGSSSESSKQVIETSDSHSGSFVITVCAKLCSLIKIQLIKALQEINNRYCPSDTFKEIVELESDSKNIARPESEFDEEPESSPDEVKAFLPFDEKLSPTEQFPSTSTTNNICQENFQVIETVPSSHKYHLTVFHPSNAHAFFRAVQREHKLLRSSLPEGVWVRAFEDRLDLLSVLIEGPKNTPYEDGLFAFDIQLGHDFPTSPPLCHYISYCSDRLNPNLYEDGKVCVSLLGTWSGRGSEVWCPSTSTLLQVIVSIQGLILVDEPYYNEAGYEKQRGNLD
jgi:ubiquitin-conjugating enzyme E2 O